jgi:predicted AlkP superfamily phosphohydrolase/phosphomutase
MPMKFDRIVVLLIVVVAVAAAVVWFGRRGASRAPEPVSGPGISVLVVGVEGLELDIVERLVAEGRLPRLSGLIDRGAVQTFENLGRMTEQGVSWTTVATGMTPEGHGIGSTVTRRGAETKTNPIPRNRTAGTIWTMASDLGRRVCVVGWPATWPAEEVNGLMMGPFEQYILARSHTGDQAEGVYPAAEYESIDALVIDPGLVERKELLRFIDSETRLGPEALVGQNYESLANSYAGDMTNVAVTLYGAGRGDTDVVCVCLEGLNTVSQRFWHYMDPEPFERLDARPEDRVFFDGQIETLGPTIDLYYEFVDELLGRLIDACDENATIAVVADHGYRGIEFNAAGQPMIGQHMHSERGCWIMSGRGVRSGVRSDEGSIMDFAPTLLAAAAMDVDTDFEGSVSRSVLE